LDLSDAVLDPPRNLSIRDRLHFYLKFRPKLVNFLSGCHQIVVGSESQKNSMRSCISDVYVIPDVSHYHNFFLPKQDIGDTPIIFVWDGQGHNFHHLENIISKNKNFFRQKSVLLKVITDKVNSITGEDNSRRLLSYSINSSFIEWDENTFMSEVAKGHVGLAPLDIKCRHSMAKPFNKMVNYHGLGLYIIASTAHSYVEYAKISPPGVDLCSNDKEWSNALHHAIKNKELIFQNAEDRHAFVVNNFNSSKLAKKWAKIIMSLS
jgi:hypothetical protein